MAEDPDSTIGEDYTARLRHRRGHMWKRLLPDPYRRNIRRLNLGRTLDVGCGIGRCLLFNDGNGIGVDHNPTSVAMCRERGLEAYGPEDFQTSDRGLFDSLLLSHVLEHLEEDAGVSLISSYLRFLRPDGKIVVITPQAAGQRSDPTHVRLVGESEVSRLFELTGVQVDSARSVPFPRPVGRFFVYNETVVTGVLRGEASGGD